MRSANRGNGNNVAIVNSSGNCNNNNAINGNRVAPDRAAKRTERLNLVQQIREHGTRSLHPAGLTRDQCGGDGSVPRDGLPASALCPADVIGFDALWESMLKCKRGVMWKSSVASFCLNGAENISKLSQELSDGTYRPRPVSHFTVTSPKRREIVGISFRDRVYQRSLNDNVVYPIMSRSWIRDNYACQEGKGTDDGRERLKCFYQRLWRSNGVRGWILSMDVQGYYPNMRHALAEAEFKRHLPGWAYEMVLGVLRSKYPGDVGYNPGSQIIQIAGVSLLSGIDHWAKEDMGAKFYCRYMDDFRVLHHDKGWLEDFRDATGEKLADIGYRLHPTKTFIRPVTDATPFLGFDFRLAARGKIVMTLDPASIKRMRRKNRRLAGLEDLGARPSGTCDESYAGWRAHASKGDSSRLLARTDEWFADLRRTT